MLIDVGPQSDNMANVDIIVSQASHARQHEVIDLMRPNRASEETIAHYEWRVLRTLLRKAVQLVKEAELNELAIVHGVHFVRRVNHNVPLQQVIHMKEAYVRYFCNFGLCVKRHYCTHKLCSTNSKAQL
jgi:hypothetical protein